MITQKPLSAGAWVPPPRDWAEEQAYNVALEVRRLRGKLSAQKLSDRTKALGHEVTRAVLSDLENGRRRHVTVAELTVLARALSTTPVALLYPDPIDGVTQMLPDVAAGQGFAMQWFSGHIDTPSLAEQAICSDPSAYGMNVERTKLARQIWELNERAVALMKQGRGVSGEYKQHLLMAFAAVQDEIRKLKEGHHGG